jgi:hypothetical protein
VPSAASILARWLLEDDVVEGRVSKRLRKFDKLLSKLPSKIQNLARTAHAQWCADPFHNSLHFKPLDAPVWSARVGDHYRAWCWASPGVWTWFWIGTHEEQNTKVAELKRGELLDMFDANGELIIRKSG